MRTFETARNVHRAAAARAEHGLRIGMICIDDPSDARVLSGMPYQTSTHLRELGVDVVPLFPPRQPQADGAARSIARRIPKGIRQHQSILAARAAVRRAIQQGKDRIKPNSAYEQAMQRARRMSREVNRQICNLDRPIDLLFGVCISTPLFEIESDVPIVYFSDATARLVLQTYPQAMAKPAGTKRAREEFESAALSKIAAGIFPSQITLDSAVNDYGLPRDKAHLVPMGSSVVPDAHDSIYPDLPSRDRLELIVVAADPVRKRLDLCVRITQVLADRGWNVLLHSIGGSTVAAAACDRVRIHGMLNLADPVDRDIHKAMLRRSHLMLLPSLGEMFGIAPGEAAHFGRPSLVSAVGGLPTVVQHGKTGLCLPVDASPEQYASEIERLCEDPNLYRAMSDAALDRARSVLNWPAFAEGVLRVLRQVAGK